jgi:hypothetical protein
MTEFHPHSDKQESVLLSQKKYVIAATGIQWGKTQVGVMRLKLAMHKYTDPADTFLVTSPTYKILYQSTLPPFLAINRDCGHYDKKTETFQIYGGGTVYFRTGKDPDSVIGITRCQHVLADEAGKYSRYFFANIVARAGFLDCPITIVTSPYNLGWLYTDFIRPYQRNDPYTHETTHLIQATSLENPYFNKDSWEKAKKKMDPRQFNMIFGGQFDRAEGLVYDCVDENIEIEAIHLPEETRIIAGIDWGYTDPFVIKVRAIMPDGMNYSIGEHYRTQQRVTQMIDTARSYMNLFGIERFYADPSRPDLISEFCANGIPCSAADNDIARGVEYHYALIKTGKYKIFRGTAPHTMDEYATYHYPEPKDLKPDQKSKDMLPVDQSNHCMDAERYVTLASFNLGKRPNRVIRSDSERKPKSMEEKIRLLKRRSREAF